MWAALVWEEVLRWNCLVASPSRVVRGEARVVVARRRVGRSFIVIIVVGGGGWFVGRQKR